MNKTGLAELDREFNAHGSTMDIATFTTRREALLSEPEPVPVAAEGQTFITRNQTIAMFARCASFITNLIAPLRARDAALERRVLALESRAPGVSINAAGLDLSVPGMEHVARAVEDLRGTLLAPVIPKYDARGRLESAQRAPSAGGQSERGATLAALTARLDKQAQQLSAQAKQIAALERKLI